MFAKQMVPWPEVIPEDDEITVRIRYETCETCHGRCRIADTKCPTCEGFGQILVRVDIEPDRFT